MTASAARPVLDTAVLTAHYEALRAQAVSEPTELATARGLAVFLRRGFVAWLGLCGELLARPADEQAPRSFAARPSGQVLSAVRTQEAVQILAGMALVAAQKGAL